MFGKKKALGEESTAKQPIYFLKGVGGQLELFENKVVILRKGALATMGHGLTGNKEILLKNITGVQLKLGGALINGYIQFTVPGGIESKRGIGAATQDENTVMFPKSENETAQAIKDKIEQIQTEADRPQVTQASSPADEIRKLKGLLDDGIIDQDDFEKKKQELLEKI
jgi:hypothetical protein